MQVPVMSLTLFTKDKNVITGALTYGKLGLKTLSKVGKI